MQSRLNTLIPFSWIRSSMWMVSDRAGRSQICSSSY